MYRSLFYSGIFFVFLVIAFSVGNLVFNSSKELPKEQSGFQWKQSEFDTILRLKGKPWEDVEAQALSGDKAALFWIGYRFINGIDTAVNLKAAIPYIEKSASLGFAPALELMIRLYNGPQNFLLSAIYVNLTIAAGHIELSQPYHYLRSLIVNNAGEAIATEIERIAANKYNEIKKNIDEIAKFKNKQVFIAHMVSISEEDKNFNNEYWSKFALLSQLNQIYNHLCELAATQLKQTIKT